MKTTTITRSLLLASLLAPAPAQQPAPGQKTTAAEQAFRDAWWAESGQGDLGAALAKYLAAAAAEGPAAVRARALLSAGAVQQRLGKAESAIATFRQLLKEHPAEADCAEQARVHLRELTAVDLTTGYDEWYERRLFSEEVQVQILDKIQALAKALGEPAAGKPEERSLQGQHQAALRGEILAFGKGAVPALRKASELPEGRLAATAVDMLFELGQVPAFAVLRRQTGWVYDADHWLLLLRAGQAIGPAAVPEPTLHERLVVATAAGPRALTDELLAAGFADDYDCAGQIAMALARHDADARRRIREAMSQRQVPLATRRAVQRALLDLEPKPPFSAAEWLAVGEDPLVFDLRTLAIDMAVRLLAAADEALFDTVLARVATASPSSRSQFVFHLANGLHRHPSQLLLPWNAARLRQIVCLAGRSPEGDFYAVWNALRSDDESRALLADAVLAEPLAIHAVFFPANGQPSPDRGLGQVLAWDDVEERQAEVLATRWHVRLAEVLTSGWPRWNDGERRAALAIVQEAVAAGGDTKALRDALTAVSKEAAPALHEPILALHESLKR